jgi:hypothetical protein
MIKMKLLPLAALLMTLLPHAANAEFGVRGTPYTKCSSNGPDAYAVAYDEVTRQPEFDEICQYPAGKAQVTAQSRCTAADNTYCQQPDDKHSLTSPADVPNGGEYWYAVTGIGDFPKVRCVCGCFVGETQLLTNYGWLPIERVLANSLRLDVKVGLPALGEGRQSDVRRPQDFTKGPERIPVLQFMTSAGSQVTLTTKHPVLVVHDGAKKMIQARAVKIGDQLLKVDGSLTEVTSITPVSLPEKDNLVYNLRTGDSSGEGGVIAVNGLRMGDLTWQLRLSERGSRESNLLAPDSKSAAE